MSSRIALAIASVLTMLLLQASFIGPLTFPVSVALPAVIVATVGIYAGPGGAMSMGFATGLTADLGSEHPAGVLALCWMGAGLLGGVIGGLATQRSYGTRPIAAMAAGIATLSTFCASLLLVVVGSHAESLGGAFRDLIPQTLVHALIGLAVVPVVRSLMRWQGVRSPRSGFDVIGRSGAAA